MTALSLERLVRARRFPPSRLRASLAAGTTVLGQSVRAARELDAAFSPAAQLRVVERFAARIDP